MRCRLQRSVGALGLLCALAASAADLDLRRLCDPYTPLTLIGVDTEGGVALFAMPSRQEGIPGWTVELRTATLTVRLYPDWRERRRFGGSVAPGPVVTASRCGEDCLQLLSWLDGGWHELGPPLSAPPTASVHTTRDAGGAPWVVLHRPAAEPGVVAAEALRLEAGGWRSYGRQPVAAVGSPAARPARGDGVLTGSGRFRPGQPPAAWVVGLPGLPGDQRGQLVPMGGDEVAYLARDGRLYLSSDGGAGWEANRWLPWEEPGGGAKADPSWAADLPVASHDAPLAVAWFDHRDPDRTELYLSERRPPDPWQVVARVPGAERLGEAEIGYSHLLRTADGRWLLVAGCEVAAGGCALRLRTVGPAGETEVHSRRLRPTWLEGG